MKYIVALVGLLVFSIGFYYAFSNRRRAALNSYAVEHLFVEVGAKVAESDEGAERLYLGIELTVLKRRCLQQME
jgi:hypothetical protein